MDYLSYGYALTIVIGGIIGYVKAGTYQMSAIMLVT